ncbi:PAS domain-containing protein [Clostridium sp. AWRP]|uniref:PAS domain-containing protein n=1 Tax=Clostridium sp. AWRP TaxID=2212991 RepID=UPI000FDB1483|nr:PAS domain-containing protein [Clostridium sp. AWRP]AZV58268.1 PAS domain-containing protein [Clostridium sp. AWRP]
MDTFDSSEEYLKLIRKYKLIAENTIECIWLFDWANKRFKYISPSIFNLRGLTVEEAMNEKLEDCLTPESLKMAKSLHLDKLSNFLAGDRREITDIYDQYCKDGTIRKIEISTKFIHNEETNSVDILGVSRPVAYNENLANKSRIYCFGKLLVYGNNSNSPIKWRTKKSEELFAYLLQNRNQKISKWEICDTLWAECSPDKVNNRLHTTLYKMKQTLNSANINFHIEFINGCYWFTLSNVYIDIIEFDYIVNSYTNITENTIGKYKKAFLLYKNRYLEGNDFVWSFTQKELYSIKYHKLIKLLMDYYMKTNNYIEAEKTILNAFKIYSLDEYVNEMCLKLYFIMKDRISFIRHYNHIKKLYKTELGIEPSSVMQHLYNAVMNND